MIVLGLDVAVHRTGWAIVERIGPREQLHDHGVLVDPTHEQIETFAQQCSHVDMVGLEEPYVDKNVATAIQLARAMGWYEHAFGSLGVGSTAVKASTWQLGLLRGLMSEKTKRDGRKTAAKLWVRATYRRTDISEDEADAVCFATWLARLGSFDQKAAASR